jgi:hypothetical protein
VKVLQHQENWAVVGYASGEFHDRIEQQIPLRVRIARPSH